MKNKILIISFISGIFFFCFYQEWIIFNFFNGTSLSKYSQNNQNSKKRIRLFFNTPYKNYQESTDILWSTSKAKTAENIINFWFYTAKEEYALDQNITLENSVYFEPKKTLYLSFNKNFLKTEFSILQKLFLIESILKTIALSELSINFVYFLIEHKPLDDANLDFSFAWPISGFSDQK